MGTFSASDFEDLENVCSFDLVDEEMPFEVDWSNHNGLVYLDLHSCKPTLIYVTRFSLGPARRLGEQLLKTVNDAEASLHEAALRRKSCTHGRGVDDENQKGETYE
jgi:hypothetical protein